MNLSRRYLLAGVSAAAVARALAQPVPLGGPVGLQGLPPGPLLGNNQGGGAPNAPPTADLNFMTPGTLPPGVVFTRASSGTYFDSSGTMRNAALNMIRNSMMVGAVPGTPGTLPTNWSLGTTPGLAWSVIGTGIEDGITYIDMRLSGTTSAINPSFVHFDPTGFAAAVGQPWALSFYVRLIGGSLTNTINISPLIFEQPSNTQRASTIIFPSNAPLATQRAQFVFTLATAGTTGVSGSFKINPTGSGVPIDATFRIGAPQVEQSAAVSAFIPTSGVANGAPRWNYDPQTLQLRGMLMETSRSNVIPNSTMVGAAAGSPGTDPTGWSANTVGGLTKTIVGMGTESGISYIDYRFNAANATVGNLNFVMSLSALNAVPASASAVYTTSVYMSFVAGSFSGLTLGYLLRINEWDSGGVSLGSQGSSTIPQSLFAIGDPLTKNRIAFTLAATPANTAFIQPYLQVPVSAGPVDFTLRIGAPQVEVGPFASTFIPTTTAAATRAVEHCSLTDAVLFGGTTDRTIMVQGYAPQAAVSPSSAYWLSLTDGTSANFINLINAFGGPNIRAQVQVASATVVNGGDRSYGTPPTTFKAALATGAIWNGAVNGVLMPTSGGASQQNGPLSIFRIGESHVATGPVDGCIQRSQYWPRALSPSELQQTTV